MRRTPKLSFAQGQLLLWILTGSLLAFGSMFLFVRVSGVSLGTGQRESQKVLLMPTANQNLFSHSDSRYVIADLFDPSLMTLPSAHGFSREMWRKKIEAQQRNLGWEDVPAFLADRPMEALRSLLEPAPVDAAVLTAAEKTSALSEEANDNETVEAPVTINQSVLRVLSALEDRGVTYAPPLPMITGSGPVRPSQVRVGVGPDGQVLYALLDHSSGDEAADAQALTLARQIQFEAARDTSGTSLAWGVVRFLWAMRGPTGSNDVTTATAP